MNRFESSPQNNPRENHDKISKTEQGVFDLLVPEYKNTAIQIDGGEFDKRYGSEEIKRDLASINRKKANFSPENPERHKRADLLEAILAEQIELSDWFGDNAMTITPSEYDDIFHAIDIMVEFEFEKEDNFQYLGLGIDITSSAISIEKKLKKIKSNIQNGQLTKMKYFSSERNPSPDFPGPMEKIPNAVIGIDARTINELTRLRLEIHEAKKLKEEEKNSDAQKYHTSGIKEAIGLLAQHRVQVLILKELEEQVETFAEYADSIGQKDIAKKYKDILKLINKILSTKKISKENEKINDTDDVYGALRQSLDNFNTL